MSLSEQANEAAVRKGLEGVVAGETAISDVDGQRCQLIYRGYAIDELAGKATYEEVSYLLLFGQLPATRPLADWTAQLAASRALEPELLALLQAFPPQADPMALLRTCVSALGLYDAEAEDEAPEAIRHEAVRVIAKLPTIVAAIGRLRAGQPLVPPAAGLGYAANFLAMLHGRPPTAQHA